MTDGRQRVLDAAHADQPAIRWQLDQRRSAYSKETWQHVVYDGNRRVGLDGYEVEVHYGRKSARSIVSATLTAPAPAGVRPVQSWLFSDTHDKAGKIAAWFADPAAAIASERGIRI